MRVMIDEATQPQLLRFAQLRLGLKNIKPNTGAEKLAEMVRAHWAEPFIEVDDHAPDGGDAGPQSERGGYKDPPKAKVDPMRYGVLDPMVGVRIHAEKGKGGDRNVPLHLNGVAYWVPRNKDVEIPLRFFRVLEEAVGEIHEGWDDQAGMNSNPREARSYTYTVTRQPTRMEIAEWEKMMEPHLDRQRKAKMARIRASRRIRDEEAAYA